jgi:predicted  nucleic acid-binding Zn-ribbon protein
MHAQYRDLDSRYRRVLNENTIHSKKEKMLNDKMNKLTNECTELKTQAAQAESQMQQDAEEIASIKAQWNIKIR